MKLARLQSATLFEIQQPVWGGGYKVVGLNRQRISKHNEIHFLYRRKSDSQLSLPDNYYFDGELVNKRHYEMRNIKGTTLVMVPFADLEVLEREP